MLTEDKIIQHANLLLEKRTLTNADYPGWVQGAMWTMRESEVEIEELHSALFEALAHLRTLVNTVEENRLSEIPFKYLKMKIENAHEVFKKYQK